MPSRSSLIIRPDSMAVRYAKLHIVEYMGRCMESKKAPVEIAKISSKGLTFRSGLRFPINPRLILRFEMETACSVAELDGRIVCRRRAREVYEYEVIIRMEYFPDYFRALSQYDRMSERAVDNRNRRINLLY